MRAIWAMSVAALALTACAPPAAKAPPMYTVSEVAPASPFSGIHGIAVAPDGKLIVGSVVGQSMFTVDPATGETKTLLGPPDGMADDIAFAPDGTMAWTGFLTGRVFVQKPGEAARVVAEGLPGANSLAFSADGKLYFTQVFLGDALYEADLTGKPPRKIAENLGGLNGFQVGPDGMIYGPLWFKGVVARVDPKTGKAKAFATGFKVPAAVNLDSKGNAWVIDTKTGELIRVDVRTGKKTTVATLSTAIDNLAIAPDDTIYVTNMADGAIHRVNPATGEVKEITKHSFAAPSDIAMDGGALWVADTFAARRFDTASGAVSDVLRAHRDTEAYPIGVDVGKTTVSFTSWSAGTVQRVDRASGQITATYAGFAGPVDALELADGSLLVAEVVSGKLLRASGADGATRDVIAEGLQGPVALALSADGGIYVSEAAGTVSRIDIANGAKTVVASGLSQPEGISFAADGRLIVAEVGAKSVSVIDMASGAKQVLATDLPIGLPAPAGSPPAFLTTGVAAGADGVIYVSSDLKNTVLKLTPPQ
jgi:sugar lactone lactonase YvrE